LNVRIDPELSQELDAFKFGEPAFLNCSDPKNIACYSGQSCDDLEPNRRIVNLYQFKIVFLVIIMSKKRPPGCYRVATSQLATVPVFENVL